MGFQTANQLANHPLIMEVADEAPRRGHEDRQRWSEW